MLHVWIDQDLCTGDGLCTDHCPELFVLLEDGISYVRVDGEPQNDPGGIGSMAPVLPEHVHAAVAAAEDCPGECIFLEELAVSAGNLTR
jgi:ferredoxin